MSKMSVGHATILDISTSKGQKMNTYPNDELAEMASAYGFTATPELIELLNKAYELGVEDTY